MKRLSIFTLLAAGALAFTSAVHAAPISAAKMAPDTAVIQVKGGHGHGHAFGHHGGRGLHLGWVRGRHLGWRHAHTWH